MSDFSITINDKGLSAQLTLASTDSTPSKEYILKKCKDLKISHGIEIDLALDQLESSSQPIIFAKCTKPKYEEDISFKWGVDLKDIYKPNIDENDNANYKDLNQFISLSKYQKIVSINKPIVKIVKKVEGISTYPVWSINPWKNGNPINNKNNIFAI